MLEIYLHLNYMKIFLIFLINNSKIVKKERKKEYNIKETRGKTLTSSVGVIKVNSTSYYNKKTKRTLIFYLFLKF